MPVGGEHTQARSGLRKIALKIDLHGCIESSAPDFQGGFLDWTVLEAKGFLHGRWFLRGLGMHGAGEHN